MKISEKNTVWDRAQEGLEGLLRQGLAAVVAQRPRSAKDYLFSVANLQIDLQQHYIDPSFFTFASDLAQQLNFHASRSGYFSGEKINSTEQRAVLHTALRRPHSDSVMIDGRNVMLEVEAASERLAGIVQQVHQGNIKGLNGERITDVINVGIGGSDLGPAMAYQALQPFCDKGIRAHFVANVDYAHTDDLLQSLNPATTLVVMVSKSFTTYETHENAKRIQAWLRTVNSDVEQVFFAVTANITAAVEFGISEEKILPMWDWVGGRFSLWSAVGLSLALALGVDNFQQLLAGAYAMDQHFHTAAPEGNVPWLMAIIEVMYQRYCDASTHALIPYSSYLKLLPDYMQQMQMESLGKRVNKQGEAVRLPTGSIIWGGVGTDSQHSFHQLLMQGTHFTPVDFILPLHDYRGHFNVDLVANAMAQRQVLMQGNKTTVSGLSAHHYIAGGCPSTTIAMHSLTPHCLGALLALYEHQVFCQALCYDINAYDQWGVQAGKLVANDVLQQLQQSQLATVNQHDALMQWILQNKD
jgi:glucose-6-phosphate isomerase